MPEVKTKKEVFGNVEIEVAYRESRRPTTEMQRFSFCPPFNPRTYIEEDDIICEQDVAVTMRDGIVIYTDIYRPVGQQKVPVIISWSMFGKRPGDAEQEWQTMGVPPGTISRMMKFESADPGYWCRQGYAVANVDPRGVGHSEGDISFFGTQDARDGYDFIEWASAQHWCTGKVGMFGNSGVGMTQLRIAAEQPPHLACIAPWEATGDLYRESFFEGGIPSPFGGGVINVITGLGFVEDVVTMSKKYPFINEYWESKTPKWENVKVPTYYTVCWNHFHCRGTIDGFRKIRSTKKWLRAHSEFEWPDAANPNNLEDLKRFFDRYLKNVRNGWEMTPRIRLVVLDAFDYDYQSGRTEKEFPLARTEYKKLYLDAAKSAMSFNPVAGESKVSYEGATGEVTFDIAFDEETEITGFMKLRLWVEADGHDDMDLFVTVQKLDEDGNWLPVSVLGEKHPGAWGKMRVSRRELDPKLSTDFQPVQAHRKDEKLKPGETVPVDIEIWPTSWIWHEGQQLRVRVAGRYIREGWFEPLQWAADNKGSHIIHTGGKYDSFLQIPVIPPKYKTKKGYVYR